MISGDYIAKKRTNKKGKLVTDKIVRSTTGVEYAIGPSFDAGGVATVYRARRIKDGLACVFKEYVPYPEKRRMHNAIKQNIKKLMARPFTEEDGKSSLKSFVGPMDKDSLIELPQSKGFGYIMELVDTDSYLAVPKLWHKETYPDALVMCKACANIAYLFRCVHLKGWCYKDINEGNIYINNKTGEVRIIDCDNIGIDSVKTIKGTDGFMAPEVYVTSTPNTITDYFSMAVLFYRMFVGGFPLDGKKTRQYLLSKGLSVQEAAAIIYGNEALFAFDPKDHSNEIRGLKDPKNPNMYALQTKKWDRLPLKIRELFIKTFSYGLSNANRHLRATDRDWLNTFKELEKSGLVRCRCGKYNFGDSKNTVDCIFCHSKLPLIKIAPKTPSAQKTPTAPKTSSAQKTPAVPISKPSKELTTVVFNAKRDIAPTGLEIFAKRKQALPGRTIYPGLNDNWMKIMYNAKLNLLAAVNQSNTTWIVTDGTAKRNCAPGERVILKPGVVITIMRRKLQLTVKEVK